MNTSIITFNKDGSVKESQLKSYIQQGNDQFDEFVIKVDNISNSEYQCKAVFKLPNGDINELIGVNFETGWKITLTAIQTILSGSVLMTLRIFKEGQTLFTYPVWLVINETGTDEEVEQTYISAEALNEFQKQLNTYQIKYNENNFRSYQSMAKVSEDLPNLMDYQTITYVDNNKLVFGYVLNHQFVLIGKFATPEELTSLEQSILLEVDNTYAKKTEVVKDVQFDNVSIVEDGIAKANTESVSGIGIDSETLQVINNKLTVVGGSGGASIDDTTIASDKVWSSLKTNQELTNVLEVAEGKTNTYYLSCNENAPTSQGDFDYLAKKYYRQDGTLINNYEEYVAYVSHEDMQGVCINSSFKSNESTIGSPQYPNGYILMGYGFNEAYDELFRIVFVNDYYKQDFKSELKTGDILLVVETDVPDRWFNADSVGFYKLETSKIDLTNLVTTNTAQTISGAKTFTKDIAITDTSRGSVKLTLQNSYYSTQVALSGYNLLLGNDHNITVQTGGVIPFETNDSSLGNNDYRWKDLYLSGSIDLNNNYKLYTDNGWFNLTHNNVAILNSNGNSQIISGLNFNPSYDTLNLGSSISKWGTLYANNISDGTNSKSITNLLYSTHIINVATTTANGTWRYQFQVSAPNSTTYTLLSQVANYLYTKKANIRINVSGTYTDNSNNVWLIAGMEAISSSQVRIEMYKVTDGSYQAIDTGAVDITDTIVG